MTDMSLPVVYLPHGGGPWPFVETGLGKKEDLDALAAYLRSLRTLGEPKAILVVSAHWEEPLPTLMTAEKPPLLFDYYGFPDAAYRLTWPAPGAPRLAERASALLAAAGIVTATDDKRGFDHGTFVPLKVTWPDAEIPTLQLSLVKGLDPVVHLAIGRALAPLRDEGVLIVGSGMSYHDMRGFMQPKGRAASEHFDGWLGETIQLAAPARDERLASWSNAPSARAAHPREEHLLPLMVIAGAAGADLGRVAYRGEVLGVKISGYHFGEESPS